MFLLFRFNFKSFYSAQMAVCPRMVFADDENFYRYFEELNELWTPNLVYRQRILEIVTYARQTHDIRIGRAHSRAGLSGFY